MGEERTVTYDLQAGEYEIRIYDEHQAFTRILPIRLEHPGTITITTEIHHMIDIVKKEGGHDV